MAGSSPGGAGGADAVVVSLEQLAAGGRRATRPRMLLVANPHATTLSRPVKDLVVAALESRFEVEAVDTQRPRHATELCREAAGEGYDLVVAFGGDGTVNEAANGLMGSPTPLAVLPGGATNVFCRMLGLPNDVVDATAHLMGLADDLEPAAIDLGLVDDRAFTFAAGVGLDASVVARVDANPELKARFGAWYFTEAAVSAFLRDYAVAPPRLEVRVGGRTVEGVSVFLQNAAPYTYFRERPVSLVEDAGIDSGQIAGVVLGRANALDLPGVARRALAERPQVGEHGHVHALEPFEAGLVASADGRPLPVQVDGDHIGERSEIVLGVARRALLVIA